MADCIRIAIGMMTKKYIYHSPPDSELSTVQNISSMVVAMGDGEAAKGNPLKIEVMAEDTEKMDNGRHGSKDGNASTTSIGTRATHIMSGIKWNY
jgi:hypothetical protein